MRRIAFVIGLLTLAGCDDRPIEQYQAPKQERPTLTVASQPVRAASVTVPMTWTLPDGWTQRPEPGAMRAATLDAPGGVEVAITVFPGDVGGTLANVNRWRQQMSLEPVASLDGEPIETYTLAERETYQVAYPGLIAAGVRDGERTWFVKMTGEAVAVTAQAEAFAAFMRSLTWD